MTDLARIGLPLQIAGFIGLLIAAISGNVIWLRLGLGVHLVGDAFFFFAMKQRGCL